MQLFLKSYHVKLVLATYSMIMFMSLEKVTSHTNFTETLKEYCPGDTIKIKFKRDKHSQTVDLVLGAEGVPPSVLRRFV